MDSNLSVAAPEEGNLLINLNVFNGGRAILETLNSLINLINNENEVNFQVYLELVSPAFLNTQKFLFNL